MDVPIIPGDKEYPSRLLRLKTPPKQLYSAGQPLARILQRPAVAIIGSRSVTPYGRKVTHEFARALAEQGVVVISGLALGVDTIAHKAALDVGGLTIAVLPRSLHNIYPSHNRLLAQTITGRGGTLVSEYADGAVAYRSSFVARNRIVAGLADAILITEAAIDSGSLHTARFAQAIHVPVLIVPGPIDSPSSIGTNRLLHKEAVAALHPDDVLRVLCIRKHRTKIRNVRGRNPQEQAILELLQSDTHRSDELLTRSTLSTASFNRTMTMLEIDGKIQMYGVGQWGLI